MDKNIYITAHCSKCGKAKEICTYPNINTQSEPDLKTKVKDGSIFLWPCPDCGQVNLTPYQTLYHDPDEKIMIWLLPKNMPQAERSLAESHIQAISKQLEEDKELLSGYTLRRVEEAGELIEKVNIFDAGLDDIAVEMCKYITKMEMAGKESDPNKAKALMDAPFKFYKIEGSDNDITLTYPINGTMQGLSIGFNVYEDCRGIIKRNPDVIPAPGFSIVNSEWLATKMR